MHLELTDYEVSVLLGMAERLHDFDRLYDDEKTLMGRVRNEVSEKEPPPTRQSRIAEGARVVLIGLYGEEDSGTVIELDDYNVWGEIVVRLDRATRDWPGDDGLRYRKYTDIDLTVFVEPKLDDAK